MREGEGEVVGVLLAVLVGVGVRDGTSVAVGDSEGEAVGVLVAVPVGVGVCDGLSVGVEDDVGSDVGVIKGKSLALTSI